MHFEKVYYEANLSKPKIMQLCGGFQSDMNGYRTEQLIVERCEKPFKIN